MELEKVTAEIRPRSEWEAIDLGIGLTRAHFGMIFKGWMATVIPACLLIYLLCWNAMGWGVFLIWWLKPIWERVALHPLSRKLFGETPTVRGTMKVLPQELIRNKRLVIMGIALTGIGWWIHHSDASSDGRIALATLYWITVLGLLFFRSGLMRSLVLPIRYLEGLSGTQYRTRTQVLGLRGSGPAIALTFFALLMEAFVFLSQFMFVDMMLPEGTEWSVETMFSDFFMGGVEAIPSGVILVIAIFYLNALSITAWFYVGGGFGLYLNSRTWTEGWDIELNFKRLGQRLGILVLGLGLFALPPQAKAAESNERASEVLQNADFSVQMREVKRAKDRSDDDQGDVSGSGIFAGIGQLIFWIVAIGILAGLIWLIVKNAHVFARGTRQDSADEEKTVRTVAGMNIAPESLPSDVLAAAQRLWAEGKFREALGLLYRGAISSLVTRRIVEIEESDTEMDCLRRVSKVGEAASAPYFETLTGAWMEQAYAKRRPDDETIQKLWASWPFNERRGR